MNSLLKYINRLLCLCAVACLLNAASAQNGTPRKYDRSGTVELEKVYHVDLTKDKTLRALGYTEAMLPDTFPAFTEYWRMHGWPRAEMLDLYLFECAWNDVIYGTDGYYGKGFYIRANFISQSRAHIVAPCGKFHVRFGVLTAIGRYTGQGAQLSSDATGTLLGGTGIELDHIGWSVRKPNRVCMNATNWGTDYGTPGIAGLAYQEGVQIEHFRLMGNKSQAGTFAGFTTGLTLNEPGEQSGIRYLMAEDFKGAGYTIFNGTPFVVETCSSFENDGPGLDLWGSNGLCNVRVETESGDNTIGQVRIRPRGPGDVGGGTIRLNNLKCEARNKLQIPILIEGVMGDLNLIVDGLTADFIGVTCPYLIGGNWTGTQFEINVRGLDIRSGVDAIAYQGSTGKKLTGGKAYSGNSFVWNDEDTDRPVFRSRANMVLSTGTVTPPSDTWTCPPTWSTCVNGSQTRTCTCSGTCSGGTTRVETQTCTVTPPPTGNTISTSGWTVTVSATNSGGRELPAYAIDADLATVWSSGIRQDASDQWIQFAAPTEQTFKTASFALPTAWSNDYARTAQVYVGSSSTGGAAVSATITGTNPMVVTFASPVKGKYFRLIAKRTNNAPNWFTVGAATFTKP